VKGTFYCDDVKTVWQKIASLLQKSFPPGSSQETKNHLSLALYSKRKSRRMIGVVELEEESRFITKSIVPSNRNLQLHILA